MSSSGGLVLNPKRILCRRRSFSTRRVAVYVLRLTLYGNQARCEVSDDLPPLRVGEEMIRNGPANHQRGIETVGGALYLTTQRLIFRPHAFNVQRGVAELELSQVRETFLCWTRFLNLLPLFPNSLAVVLDDGKEHRFVVENRSGWKAQIDELLVAMRAKTHEGTDEHADVRAAWRQLEAAIAKALPETNCAFAEPATNHEIRTAEAALGLSFVEEVRVSFRTHNGDSFAETSSGSVVSNGPFRHIDFLPLAAVANEWSTWQEHSREAASDYVESDPQVVPQHWHRRWIPFTVIGGATTHHCIDLAPTPSGRLGQIIEVDAKNSKRRLIAPSLGGFLASLADEIESGVYVVRDAQLVHRDRT